MKKALSIIFALCISLIDAQPTIQWQKDYGGTGWEGLYKIIQTSDGGYVCGGYSDSNISGDKTQNSKGVSDFWILRLNGNGNLLWEKTIGGSGDEGISDIRQTSDKGFIVSGASDSPISGDKSQGVQGADDYWFVKLDSLGNIQWEKRFGGSGGESVRAIRQTADGGYVIFGITGSVVGGDKTVPIKGWNDIWIVKINSIGLIKWQKDIGAMPFSFTQLRCVDQTNDGGFILGASTDSGIGGDKTQGSKGGTEDCWIIKTDSLANIIWDKTIGGSLLDAPLAIHQKANGRYVVSAISDSPISGDKTQNCKGGSDFWLFELDVNGNVTWDKVIGGSGGDSGEINFTADGGYMLSGLSSSPISGDKTQACFGNNDYWFVKLDSARNIVSQVVLGGIGNDDYASGGQSVDGGFFLAGSSDTNISGNKNQNSWGWYDFWIVKLAGFPLGINNNNSFQESNLTVYPNPTNGSFSIKSNEDIKIKLINELGQIVLTDELIDNNNRELKIDNLESGLYFINAENGYSLIRKKISIIK